MPTQTRIVSPGPRERTVRTAEGTILEAPADWILLPPGDPGLTRRVKAAGPTWTVQEKKGRKTFSRGVWTPAAQVEAIQAELAAERSTPAYAKRKASDSARREKKQTAGTGVVPVPAVVLGVRAPDRLNSRQPEGMSITKGSRGDRIRTCDFMVPNHAL